MSPSVEPARGGVYARRADRAVSRRFPDVTSSAYCVWQFVTSGSEDDLARPVLDLVRRSGTRTARR
jgi:hypothetical protein